MAEKHSDKIPQYEINALARCLLPEIQKFFASPEGQKEFEEWKAQRAKEAEQHKSDLFVFANGAKLHSSFVRISI